MSEPRKLPRNRSGYFPCVICRKAAMKGLMRCKKCHDKFVSEMPDEVGPVIRSGNGIRLSDGDFEGIEDQVWLIREDK